VLFSSTIETPERPLRRAPAVSEALQDFVGAINRRLRSGLGSQGPGEGPASSGDGSFPLAASLLFQTLVLSLFAGELGR